MFYALYQLIVLLSAGASAGLWLVRPVRPVLGVVGAGGWMIVTLQARNIEILRDSTTYTRGSEAFQYLALGLALFNIATVVLWYLGVYPPTVQDGAGRADVPDDPAAERVELDDGGFKQ